MALPHAFFKRPASTAPSSSKPSSDRSLLFPTTHPSARHRLKPKQHSQRAVMTSAANSAASWQALPSADSCEVASAFNQKGQEMVTARIVIQAKVQQVWSVLTDFEKLVDVVPNLIACEEVPSPNPKCKRLRQSAGLKCSWWKLQAQALLEIRMNEESDHKKELHFTMIEGDFKEYSGRFSIKERSSGLSSILVFDAVIEPLESIPKMLFNHAVQIWLPFNLNGIVKKAEQIAQKETRVSPFAEASMDSQVSLENTVARERRKENVLDKELEKTRRRRKRANPSDYLGTAFVPLPATAPEFTEISRSKQSTLPAIELDHGQLEGVEVHLRKLDTDDVLHRRVVCSLRIGASVEAVWRVLTDYERLVDFVPNLTKSEVLPCPPNAPDGYFRIRQVVQKFQTYIQLRAESVLDIVERPYKEIQFRQVSGFVDKLQGKWIIQSVKNEWSPDETDTLLTYALEIKTSYTDIPLELIEPVFEQAAVEGLPLNLTAIKQEVLRLQGRPSLLRLCGDFEALRDEVCRSYIKDGTVFPTRLQLRKDRRSDLEKAISSHGGPAAVCERMGWRMQIKKRKRRGYWDDFDNLKQELMEFKVENGLEVCDRFPSKSDFNQAGRTDLRRAVEKWGGIHAVMELILMEDSEEASEVNLPIEKSSLEQQPKMNINVRDVDLL